MRVLTKALLGAGAVMTLAGGALAAGKAAVHTAEIPLGDGQVATVRYVGDVPPRIRIVPIESQVVPVMEIDPSFAAFDRMVAEMNARQDAMLRQVAALSRMSAGTTNAPPGVVRYSFTSTTGADGCTRTVQTSYASGQAQPQVVRQQSAGCRETDRTPTPVAASPAPAPVKVTPVRAPALPPRSVDPRTI